MATGWWEPFADERFWLEATDRADLGADLRAPEFDDKGADNWRYNLFKRARVGDIVFHYDKRPQVSSIVAYSTIAGAAYPHAITWVARGTVARLKGAPPRERPGYRIPLTDTVRLRAPVSLGELRSQRSEIEMMLTKLAQRIGKPLYFPFELSTRRDLRLLQGYAFKLPRDFVEAFKELAISLEGLVSAAELDDPLSNEYKVSGWQDSHDLAEAPEGRLKVAFHHRRERDRRLVAAAKRRALAVSGRVVCAACGFDPAAAYGVQGLGAIECHHTRALRDMVPGDVTRVEDLALLCANCHRVIHAASRWLSIEELQHTINGVRLSKQV